MQDSTNLLRDKLECVEQVYQLYFPGSEQQSRWSDYADVEAGLRLWC